MTTKSSYALDKHRFSYKYLNSLDLLTLPMSQEYLCYCFEKAFPNKPKRYLPRRSYQWLYKQVRDNTKIFPNAKKMGNLPGMEPKYVYYIPKNDLDHYVDNMVQKYSSDEMQTKTDGEVVKESVNPTPSKTAVTVSFFIDDEDLEYWEFNYACYLAWKNKKCDDFSSNRKGLTQVNIQEVR